jgi:hypothetical protein
MGSSASGAGTLGHLLRASVRGTKSNTSLAAREFVLENPVDHPFYNWPRTLLTYELEGGEHRDSGRLRLTCVQTGESVPLQISRAADRLRFFAELPAGESRNYRLQESEKKDETAAVATPRVSITSDGQTIILDSGPLQVRIPASQTVQGKAPGPVLQMCRESKWFGQSTLAIPNYSVTRLTTECIESGPLFAAYRMTYEIEGGGRYLATVECMAGMDFVRLREEMMDLPTDAEGTWEFVWEGCDFTHRQMPDHPYPFPARIEAGHTYEDYGWERMDATVINTHIGLSRGMDSHGLMDYAVGVYQPWPVWTVGSFISFWDRMGGDAAAVFIDRAESWIDPDYPIWHASMRLCVRFICKEKALMWRWPLVRGARSTGMSFYHHRKDIEWMETIEKLNSERPWHDGRSYQTDIFPASYGQYLQNRYGTIDLDRVKDWVLTYGDDEPQPGQLFYVNKLKGGDELENDWVHSSMATQLPLSGTRQNSGYGPVPGRSIVDTLLPAFNQFHSTITAEQKRRCTALFLMNAYVAAGEDYMPMIPMLSGHPNFLSDVKSIPAAISYLFPDHPLAKTWVEELEKYMELNTHCHTRPAVRAWNAKGGRWTENIGTYVWGFLRPALRVHYLLNQTGYYNRVVTPQLAELGDWLVNALSAPFNGENEEFLARMDLIHDAHSWGVVRPTDGPARVHPPIGAHSERRRPPRSMWYLGTILQQYAPLTAEHLMWAARRDAQDEEILSNRTDPWCIMGDLPENRGTNPHLRSSKYTGYGITLRAAVDTPKELSIHLQQIDDGPNYRWGVAAEGGCGLLYFYAGGKGYSHNAIEDDGDRDASDTDYLTNFGVWKDGYFKCIGQNVLSRPMYDLEVAQFAEIVPRTGAQSYCTPEYVSRSILLAGSDYFLLYDHVFNESIGHRLSWFVRRGDSFPHITRLRGNRPSGTGAILHPVDVETEDTVGKWFEGTGDSLACITHREGIVPAATAYGARVHTPETEDWVFFHPADVQLNEAGIVFRGTVGLVRQRGTASEICLIHGDRIGARGYMFHVSNREIGISARIEDGKPTSGRFIVPIAGTIEIEAADLDAKMSLYLDGVKLNTTKTEKILKVQLAQGIYEWQLTDVLPVPLAPSIVRTEGCPGGARIFGTAMGTATRYRLERSDDNGTTWKRVADANRPEFTIVGLTNEKKYHVRLVAINDQQESKPGPEYPLYVTHEAPLPPAGLSVQLREGEATLTWGEVLGVKEYRLYRKGTAQTDFILCYRGLDCTYRDRNASIHPCDRMPETSFNDKVGAAIEYYVTAVNTNGESKESQVVDTNPGSWRNWNPVQDEPFRRAIVAGRYGSAPNDGLGDYYPESCKRLPG